MHRFLNFVYTWCVERTQDRERFDFLLNEPLPGEEKKVSDGVAEVEGAAFMQVMQMHRQVTGG